MAADCLLERLTCWFWCSTALAAVCARPATSPCVTAGIQFGGPAAAARSLCVESTASWSVGTTQWVRGGTHLPSLARLRAAVGDSHNASKPTTCLSKWRVCRCVECVAGQAGPLVCACAPGWTGPSCSVRMTCVWGTLLNSSPPKCLCNAGFSGPQCDIPIPEPITVCVTVRVGACAMTLRAYLLTMSRGNRKEATVNQSGQSACTNLMIPRTHRMPACLMVHMTHHVCSHVCVSLSCVCSASTVQL